jgi:hypothetical protein
MEPFPTANNSENPDPKGQRTEANDNEVKALIGALVEIEKANGEAEDAERKRNRSHQNWHMVLTIIEIALVLIYAIYTVKEWKTFDSERSMMKTELDAAQANNEIDQRAWLSIGSVRLAGQYKDGSIFGMIVEIKNSGKTPATMESIKASVGRTFFPNTNVFWFFETNYPAATIPPGEQLPLKILEKQPINSVEFKGLVSKMVKHYFAVKIQYRDIFGHIHRTEDGIILTGSEDQLNDPMGSWDSFGSQIMN